LSVVQSVPHAPQFFTSDCKLVQAPLQLFGLGAAQLQPTPLLHVSAPAQAEQAAPLPPHSLDDCALVTQPLPSQQPLGQELGPHATHAPAVQIWPAPQVLPSLMLVGEPHTGPALQDIVPTWQGFPGGMHIELGAQLTHIPLPSHTPFETVLVWQGVPAFAGVF
jgi:hypothetical protein